MNRFTHGSRPRRPAGPRVRVARSSRRRHHRDGRRRAPHRLGPRMPHLADLHPRARWSHAEMGYHSLIEFGNRLMTGVVGIVALVLFVLDLADPSGAARPVHASRSSSCSASSRRPSSAASPSGRAQPVHRRVPLRLVAPARVRHAPPTSCAFDATPGRVRARRAAAGTPASRTRRRPCSPLTIVFGVLTTASGPHSGDAAAGRNGFGRAPRARARVARLRAARPHPGAPRRRVAARSSHTPLVVPSSRSSSCRSRSGLYQARNGLPPSRWASTWCSPRSRPRQ